MSNDFSKYHEAVSYIDSLSNLPLFAEYMSGVQQPHPEIFIKRMRYFLNLLGNPQDGFKYVHVTGTAGKGTVATSISNILTDFGKVCGLFTSPFVVSPIEKIQVGDLYIDPIDFADLVTSIKPAIDTAYRLGEFGRPSHFEIYFAVALLYFKKKKCEWVVLEVGCGGRFDATNVIKSPEISVITCIDYDHMEILGKTLNKIAFDKAGIIKKGSKFFTTEKRLVLRKMFAKICMEQGAIFESVVSDDKDPNVALATRVCKELGISEAIIQKGLARTVLPARFEIVSQKPLIIIDGAHNRAKIARTIFHLQQKKFKKLFLIFAVADNKDTSDILEQVIPIADVVFLTRFLTKDRKPAPPIRLLKEVGRYVTSGTTLEMFLDSKDALARARKEAGAEDCILITGSFFLAGELRAVWFPEEQILKTRRSF